MRTVPGRTGYAAAQENSKSVVASPRKSHSKECRADQPVLGGSWFSSEVDAQRRPDAQRDQAVISQGISFVTRRARYGAAHGVFGTIYDVGDALGPIAAGFLVAAIGYTRMFQVMAAVALTMAVAFAFASRSGVTGRVAPRT